MTSLRDALVPKIAVIGTGLIGSSVLRGVKASHAAQKTSLYDQNDDYRVRAKTLKLADDVCDNAIDAVAYADVVILAVPVGAIEDVMQQIAGSLQDGAIISDVGSVKGEATRIMRKWAPGNVSVVPGHPIAGTEHSGPDAGFAELFHQRWQILTPPDGEDPKAVKLMTALWQRLGSQVEVMKPDHHDRVLAITSHLPHLIAYSIVGTVAELEEETQSEVIKFSASGFRDFTRIAASDPVMWRDVFLQNKDAVLEMLGRYTEDLTSLQKAVRRGDGKSLEDWFERTRAVRRGIIDANQAGGPHYFEVDKAEQ